MILIELNASRLLRSSERWERAHSSLASQGPAAPLMGSFEFPRLILRDRLHINYSIIELNSYLAGNIHRDINKLHNDNWHLRHTIVSQFPCVREYSVEDDMSCNPGSVQVTRKQRQCAGGRGTGAQDWVSYLQCTLCIVLCLPSLLRVHSKINSNFSVILVASEDQVETVGDLRHCTGHIDTNLTQSPCWLLSNALNKYLKRFVVIIVPIILCPHSPTWAVSNQPHFLAI